MLNCAECNYSCIVSVCRNAEPDPPKLPFNRKKPRVGTGWKEGGGANKGERGEQRRERVAHMQTLHTKATFSPAT